MPCSDTVQATHGSNGVFPDFIRHLNSRGKPPPALFINQLHPRRPIELRTRKPSAVRWNQWPCSELPSCGFDPEVSSELQCAQGLRRPLLRGYGVSCSPHASHCKRDHNNCQLPNSAACWQSSTSMPPTTVYGLDFGCSNASLLATSAGSRRATRVRWSRGGGATVDEVTEPRHKRNACDHELSELTQISDGFRNLAPMKATRCHRRSSARIRDHVIWRSVPT
jgi:hypothetical protein